MSWCELCSRSFGSQDALDQHVRDAPAHVVSHKCNICDRSFRSPEALEQHVRNAPAHVLSHRCTVCERSFRSPEALDQHTQNSPRHAPSYSCGQCDRSFRSQDALDQHCRDSATHQLPTTPLNSFFQSFAGFRYDPRLPPNDSFSSLQRRYGWHRGDEREARAWKQFQQALTEEFDLWFGAEDDIATWHALCYALRITPPPPTCRDCKKVVRKVYVNIIDLIEWARTGRKNGDIHLFRNLGELRDYTQSTRRIYHPPRTEDGSTVLRHLRRVIF
ncbi:hypothetical protein BJX64DRAFT_261998 [Aspergillus heterothallicus]